MNNYCIKITNLFRQLKKEKDDSHEKLYKEYSQIPSSEYILDLNNNEFGVNLAPEQNCLYLGTKFKNKKDGLGLEIFSDTKSKYIISNGFQEYNYYGQIKGIYARGFGWLEDKKNSIYYEGKWENSMKNGYGIEINQNDNSEYRGTFSNGKKHGIGYYLWNDGSYYEGEWKENKLDGYGIYTFKDGSLYKGEWKENELDGFGEFSYPGVKTYIGYFQRDLRNGFGILIWFKIKKVFIGFWKNNKQNGIGKFIKNDKIIYGIWREGELETKINTKIEFDTKLNKGEYGFLKYFQFENYERFYEYMKKFIDMNEKY